MFKKVILLTSAFMLCAAPVYAHPKDMGIHHGRPQIVVRAPHRPAPHAWKIHHNHGDFVVGGIIAGVVGGIVSSALSSQSPTYVVSENAAANTVTYSVPNQKNCTTFVSAYGDVTQHCVSSY